MINAFDALTEEEKEFMYKVPAMVTIYIAGADNDIAANETETAQKVTHFRSLSGDAIIQPFFDDVQYRFENDLKKLILEYPKDAETRNQVISRQLERVNEILPKLHPDWAYSFYRNMKSLASRVASASGGFFRFLSVGREEKKLVDLHMIHDPSLKQS